MNPRPLTMSANYLVVVRGLRELHRLRLAGRHDSPEADAVRDATDAPWAALTEVEKRRISELSADLYSITDPPQAAPLEMNPQVQARLIEASEARQRGEWDRALGILRRWAPYIEPAVLSYLRGRTWLDAGDPGTAALFFEHASRLQPENSNYLALFLAVLNRSDRPEARRRAQQILESPDQYDPAVIARAADVDFGDAASLPRAEASRLFRRLVPILESALDRIEANDQGGFDGSTFSLICNLLGSCHEAVGENQAAVASYSRGIVADPSNHGLLTARGMLLYGRNPQAIQDLERAIQSGGRLIWPYFLLAHHALVSGQFERCRSLAERALEMKGSDALNSELAEWLAIAQSELGYPADVVRGSFDRALRLDPTNERARHNLAAFEAAPRPIPAGAYETRDSSSIRVSGLSEWRTRPAA